MKRYMFAAIGVLLATLALGGMIATVTTHDPINFIVTCGLGTAAWRSIRAARRAANRPTAETAAPERRRWQR